jgi:CCR4-NOT transcriptional regulation complex NOT5 subunit
MKKVDEGVELFDEIWEKVYTAEQQNQKEKYEMDLKKEIKKLQRLRDQIKTWIGSSDVKDKEPLLEARKLIETKMEQFKVCEKETKTKTYSKEGLARQEKLDPGEQAKRDTTEWISDIIDKLNSMVEDQEVEIEQLSSGKGKKTNKHLIDDLHHYITQHKFHLNKLEGIMRLVNNDVLDVDDVDPIKEDLEYYHDSYDDEDYQQAYDEEFFYEALGLDDLAVVNVDRVTQAAAPTKDTDAASSSGSKSSSAGVAANKKAKSLVIPLNIGRARTSSKGGSKGREEEPEKTPKKREPTPTVIQAARPAAPPVAGASMAAILKRETEQQEKERQKVSRTMCMCIVLFLGTSFLVFSVLTDFTFDVCRPAKPNSCASNSSKRSNNSNVNNKKPNCVNNKRRFVSNSNDKKQPPSKKLCKKSNSKKPYDNNSKPNKRLSNVSRLKQHRLNSSSSSNNSSNNNNNSNNRPNNKLRNHQRTHWSNHNCNRNRVQDPLRREAWQGWTFCRDWEACPWMETPAPLVMGRRICPLSTSPLRPCPIRPTMNGLANTLLKILTLLRPATQPLLLPSLTILKSLKSWAPMPCFSSSTMLKVLTNSTWRLVN